VTHQGKGNSRTLIKEGHLQGWSIKPRSLNHFKDKKVSNPSFIKEVYIARRRALHKGTYKEDQIGAVPTSTYKSSSKFYHQESPLGEGNLKNIKIKGRQAIKASRRKQIHYISKIYQVSICPLLNIHQCLFAKKATNWWVPINFLHWRRGLIYFSKRMNS